MGICWQGLTGTSYVGTLKQEGRLPEDGVPPRLGGRAQDSAGASVAVSAVADLPEADSRGQTPKPQASGLPLEDPLSRLAPPFPVPSLEEALLGEGPSW